MIKKLVASLLALSLTLAICLIFGGCGGKSNGKNESDSKPRLIIASDEYEPFSYIGENGDYTGIDVELAREACKRIGYTPVFEQIDWSCKDEILSSGKVDCIWGCFSMTGREENYLWAGPYLYSRQVAMVKKDSKINHLSELSGKKISAQIGSKPEAVFLDESNPKNPKVKDVLTFSTMDEVLTAMSKNYVDAAAGHEASLMIFNKTSNNEYRILPESILTVQLGVAFDKNADSKVAQLLTNALNEMKNDGTTERIVKKYGLDEKSSVWGDSEE